MVKSTKTLFVILLLILGKTSFAKNNSLQPELHIITNKEVYLSGEPVFFQVFLRSYSYKAISTSFTVSLYTCTGEKIVTKKRPLIDNTGAGSLELPYLSPGNYLLYANTICSNISEEIAGIRKITITNNTDSLLTTSITSPYNANEIETSFFFEGNTFIAELTTNLLVKTFLKTGSPISVRGKIINEKNELLSVFSTNRDGFIKTSFISFKNEKCFIVIKDNAGNEKITPLPMALEEGVALHVESIDSSIYYRLQHLSPVSSGIQTHLLEIFSANQSVYRAELTFEAGKSQVEYLINSNSLPPGYLFFKISANNQFLAGRLYLNLKTARATKILEIADTTNHKTFTINLPGQVSGKGAIRAGIFQKKSMPDTLVESDDITSVISGNNNNPFNEYLISQKNLSGYGIDTSSLKDAGLLSLEGTLLSLDNKPIINSKVNIILYQNNLQKSFFSVLSDEKGKIQLDNLNFTDTATIYYQLANKTENKNAVTLKDIKTPGCSNNPFQNISPIKFDCNHSMNLSENKPTNLQDTGKLQKTLQEVKLTSNRKTDKELFVEKYVSPQFNFAPSLALEMDFISKPVPVDQRTILDYIQSKLMGIKFSNNPEIKLTDISGSPIYVYLNEQKVEPGVLTDYQIYDIALIRQYYSSFSPSAITDDYTSYSKNKISPYGGCLVIYTKRGFIASDKSVAGLPKLKVVGYDPGQLQYINFKDANPGLNIFWLANHQFSEKQVIYLNLPLTIRDKSLNIRVEGINDDNVPFLFTKNIILDE